MSESAAKEEERKHTNIITYTPTQTEIHTHRYRESFVECLTNIQK